MNTPPFLLGATLVFWGWQSGLLAAGVVMGAVLEGARVVRTRWDLSDEDFSRIWTFCTLLFLAAAVYAFTDNGGPESFRSLFQAPTLSMQRRASIASARTASSIIRWLPMLFFLFVAAQAYSTREKIPFHAISLILQRRWRRAKKLGRPLPPGRDINVGYPFLVMCLFAASVHRNEDKSFFYGASALLIWALWPYRSRRFGLVAWAAAFVVAIVLGFYGQYGISELQRYLEGVSPQWIAKFLRHGEFDPAQNTTEIGNIGRLKTSMKIVIRLEPKEGNPPSYLRSASYRRYKLKTWYADDAKVQFEPIAPETNNLTWVLVPGKTNVATVNIAAYLSGGRGLLPLPERSGQLDNLPAYILQKNSGGAVLAEGPGLVMFDAHYGPGATIDSPPDPEQDLYVWQKEFPALDQIVAELRLKEKTPDQALFAIRDFFQNKFKYSLWTEPNRLLSTNQTPLGNFLLYTRSGHCEYFATATVLLLRHIGVKARYAVGFAVHETSGSGYVIRARDAHSWCLVWNERSKQWEDLDTTPPTWLSEESKDRSSWQWLADGWSWVGFQFSKLRWGQGRLREYILLSVLPVLVILLYQIIRRRRRHHGSKGKETRRPVIWPGLDSEFYQVEQQLAERGCERQPNEPLSDWLERALASPTLSDLRGPLKELLRLHYRYRFDPEGLQETDRETLRREARACLEGLMEMEPASPSRKGG